jgi:hypothetical protein
MALLESLPSFKTNGVESVAGGFRRETTTVSLLMTQMSFRNP